MFSVAGSGKSTQLTDLASKAHFKPAVRIQSVAARRKPSGANDRRAHQPAGLRRLLPLRCKTGRLAPLRFHPVASGQAELRQAKNILLIAVNKSVFSRI
jgi:hypothetical protein